jgi:hypothetical protein
LVFWVVTPRSVVVSDGHGASIFRVKGGGMVMRLRVTYLLPPCQLCELLS